MMMNNYITKERKYFKNIVKEQCYEILKNNPKKSFTAEKLNQHTGHSIRSIKYNMNQVRTWNVGVEEGYETIKYPKGSTTYSTGYYYDEELIEKIK